MRGFFIATVAVLLCLPWTITAGAEGKRGIESGVARFFAMMKTGQLEAVQNDTIALYARYARGGLDRSDLKEAAGEDIAANLWCANPRYQQPPCEQWKAVELVTRLEFALGLLGLSEDEKERTIFAWEQQTRDAMMKTFQNVSKH